MEPRTATRLLRLPGALTPQSSRPSPSAHPSAHLFARQAAPPFSTFASGFFPLLGAAGPGIKSKARTNNSSSHLHPSLLPNYHAVPYSLILSLSLELASDRVCPKAGKPEPKPRGEHQGRTQAKTGHIVANNIPQTADETTGPRRTQQHYMTYKTVSVGKPASNPVY
ncbi:hypothetical protein CNYM01_12477 [Colletotrichum nymphaeae SA-01]|uniref:Uncharacterized protein n=1 Tax=Colletotrichum nymphaeae SA-01 TaxID=1460502 RepID=A0A135SC29_9PEZI|nr:hypothetical protein CNYM01_12477 [Colletotrichum nymphaeae SA-01]